MHCQADLPGIGTLNAMSYGRARSRVSYNVLCRQRTRLGSEQRRVAPVQHFLLAKAPDRPTLRLAVVDIFQHQPLLCDGAVHVAKSELFERRGAALPVDAVDAVLVSAARPDWRRDRRSTSRVFARTTSRSSASAQTTPHGAAGWVHQSGRAWPAQQARSGRPSSGTAGPSGRTAARPTFIPHALPFTVLHKLKQIRAVGARLGPLMGAQAPNCPHAAFIISSALQPNGG